ncbi:5-demethoxyubiquinone hydroxylase, mitochondrial [Aphelenchoides besseyi]|nr:5-demethoxyubiquinone hydroxylase, mitochondrial [Aphelenchoides besseyi]KAI6228231.1 5-demethoxyubiquinone hydroxylase, mitochondrial [Aphelenchoides besseyi]
MIRALEFFGLCQPYRQALVSSIVRVNHAGELAADQIYAGQSKVLAGTEVGPVIQEMWDEEKEHLQITERYLAKYEVGPTVFTPLFKSMAFGLGVGTALMGKESAMACTIAVEELIGKHYNEQIRKLIELGTDDEDSRELLRLIRKMRDDELHHHDTGIEYHGLNAPFYQNLKWVIQTGCKAAIWTAERV